MPHLHLIFGDLFLSNFPENAHEAYFKKVILINGALFVSQMLSLFSRTNSAYVQISLKEIHASLQLFKKFKISTITKKIFENGRIKNFVFLFLNKSPRLTPIPHN